MTRKGKRLTLIAGAMAVLGVAAGLMLFALRDNIVFFYTPSGACEEANGLRRAAAHRRSGEGGTVVKNGQDVRFTVTDKTSDVTVSYTGLLPDLFREGQGVVVDGRAAALRRLSGRTACWPNTTNATCRATSPTL